MPHAYCAIDFGTSNSAIALPDRDDRVALVEVEPGQRTMPTAVFYTLEGTAPHEEPKRLYGRQALAAYVEGHDGRLMRSIPLITRSPRGPYFRKTRITCRDWRPGFCDGSSTRVKPWMYPSS